MHLAKLENHRVVDALDLSPLTSGNLSVMLPCIYLLLLCQACSAILCMNIYTATGFILSFLLFSQYTSIYICMFILHTAYCYEKCAFQQAIRVSSDGQLELVPSYTVQGGLYILCSPRSPKIQLGT